MEQVRAAVVNRDGVATMEMSEVRAVAVEG